MRAGTDVAVVGAGIAGLATAAAVTELGATVTVYERAAPGEGQSGGDSRIFRHLHDDVRLVALAREARAGWREWEERFGVELLAADGVVAVGPGAHDRLEVVRAAGGVRARAIDAAEAAERLPALAPPAAPAVLDEDGGVIRTRAAIRALVEGLGSALVAEEVLALRATAGGAVEVRTAGAVAEHGHVVVCAGRGTQRLAAGLGLALPVAHSAHVRLAFALRDGSEPAPLACLLDGSGAFGEPSAYGDPLPGNRAFAVGLGDVPVGTAGSPLDPAALAAMSDRIEAYVARALPGLAAGPVDVRHCWVTALPWNHDAIAAWQLDGITVLAGNNLFKHAPAVGRRLARAALGEGLGDELRPQARLGAPV